MPLQVAFTASLVRAHFTFTGAFVQLGKFSHICTRRRYVRPSSYEWGQTLRALVPAATASVLTEDMVLQFQSSSGLRRLARAVKPDGKRNWIVHDSNGVSHSISAKQITFIIGPMDPSPSDLRTLDAECHQRAVENRELLQLVWEAVGAEDWEDDKKMADIEAIADLVFSDSAPLSRYSTHLLLSEDRFYFKERNIKGRMLYEARTEAQVAESMLMLEAEDSVRQAQESRRTAFLAAHHQKSIDPLRQKLPSTELEEMVEALKSIAFELEMKTPPNVSIAFESLGQQSKDLVREALSSAGKKVVPSAAMEVLVAWGIFKEHENLVLLTTNIPHVLPFDGSLIREAEGILSDVPKDLDKERRTDYSHLASYAVDSSETTEVDDAIAWDSDSNRVLVHIADPTRYFPDGPSNAILLEVFRRMSTLYLPYQKFTMFPEKLAQTFFSLDGIESDGSALTFAFSLDDDGAFIEDSVAIEPSIISPPVRFTYEEVEDILKGPIQCEEHKDFHTLYQKAMVRHNWREMEGGAICINGPFSDIKVEQVEEEHPVIKMSKTPTDTKSWILIQELMIAACSVGANFAAKHQIPVPFRGQEPFDYPEDDVLNAISNEAVRAAAAFRHSSPPQIHTEPLEHATLGLDAYLQLTSPIRRGFDLIAHFQIKAFLRGDELPFTAEEVQREIGRNSDGVRLLRQVENRTKKYWQLEYLRRLGPEAEHEGVFLRYLKDGETRLGLVHLEDFAFSLVVSIPQPCKPGTQLRVRVQEANPRTGFSRSTGFLTVQETDNKELLGTLDDSFSDVSSDSERA